MFENIMTFLTSFAGSDQKEAFDAENPRVAVIALCLQVMDADGTVSPQERATLETLIKDHYEINDAEFRLLLAAGENAEKDAVDFFRFTTILKRALDEEQKAELIGILWELVYSDGQRSELEDSVIWRISELLGVDGRTRIIKRQEAEAKHADTLWEAGDSQQDA
jgi:uncharacterized tellurite resistance protein B-like protein